jgi:hypothetical protein
MTMRDLSGSGESSVSMLSTSLKLATTFLVLSALGGCCWLDMKEQDASARALMHSGTVWLMPERPLPMAPLDANDDAARLRAVEDKYVYGKELRFGSGRWWFGQNKPVKMCVINQSLICGPLPPGDVDRWQCDDVEPVTQGPLACGALEDKCAKVAMGFAQLKLNFVGLVENEFCLAIGIVEKKDKDKREDDQPTDIRNDSLAIQVFPQVYKDDDGGPGIIPVPPRPNFRNPVSEKRVEPSNSQSAL